MKTLVDEIVAKIKLLVQQNPTLLTSAVSIITMGYQLMRQANYKDVPTIKATLLQVLERVAQGPDGVLGTADDIIPIAVMEEAIVLLQTDMGLDFITAIVGNAMLEYPNLNETRRCFCF